MKKIIILNLIFLTIFLNQAIAFEQPMRFETPRTLALGGAFTALSDDPSAIFYNPAGLGTKKKSQITMELGSIYQSYNWDEESLAPWGKWTKSENYLLFWENQGIVGMTYRQIGNKNDKISTPADTSKYAYPSFNEITVSISASEEISKDLLMGFRATYINLNSDYWDANLPHKNIGVVDMGLLYSLTSNIKIGLTTRNFLKTKSSYLIFDEFGNTLPIKELPEDTNFGICVDLNPQVNLLADITNIMGRDIEFEDEEIPSMSLKRNYHFGAEVQLAPSIVVRGGFYQKKIVANFNERTEEGDFEYSYRSNFCLGLGLQRGTGKLNLGIALDNLHEEINGTSHRYSASFNWTF